MEAKTATLFFFIIIMNTIENILIDTIEFNPPLPMEYKEVIGRFDSTHDSSCCERHELRFDETKQYFETAKQFISKVDKIEIKWTPWMGITLRLIDGEKEFWIFVPWEGSNNWYYGDNIDLHVKLRDGSVKTYDCTEYQNVK